MSRRMFVALALGLVLAVVSACGNTGSGPIAKLNNTLIEVTTPEARSVRACMATAIMAEVQTYRLNYHGGTMVDHSNALASMDRMKVSLAKVKADADYTWIETEMFYVRTEILHNVAPEIKSRVLNAARSAVGGDFGSLITAVRTTAGQVRLADSMIVDINRYFNANDLTTEDGLAAAWAVCEARVEFNQAALGG